MVQLNITFFCTWRTHTYYIIFPQAIVKLKLVQPILRVLVQLMCTPVNEEEEYFSVGGGVDDDDKDEEEDDYDDEDDEGDDDDDTPMTGATRLLNKLALYLPPEKLLPPLVISPSRFYSFENKKIILSTTSSRSVLGPTWPCIQQETRGGTWSPQPPSNK
jgi:hypothetical protein